MPGVHWAMRVQPVQPVTLLNPPPTYSALPVQARALTVLPTPLPSGLQALVPGIHWAM